MPSALLGPQAFTYFAQQTGDFEKALTSDYLYPVPFQLNDVLSVTLWPGRHFTRQHAVGASLYQRHQALLAQESAAAEFLRRADVCADRRGRIAGAGGMNAADGAEIKKGKAANALLSAQSVVHSQTIPTTFINQ